MRRSPVSRTKPRRNAASKAASQRRRRRPKRLPRDERRLRLIETARGVFAKYGFNGTTTRQLARAAGVTEALMFQHFRSKEALYAAVLEASTRVLWSDESLDALEARLRADDDAGFVRVLYTHVIQQSKQDGLYYRLQLYSALEAHAVTDRVQTSTVRRLRTLLRRFILNGQKAGRCGPGSVGVLIRALIALPTHHMIQEQIFRTPWQACKASEELEVGVEFVLAGLRRQGFAGQPSKGVKHRLSQHVDLAAINQPRARP